MESANKDIISELAKVLLSAGWKIVKFENLDGAVTLTILPQER